MTPTEKARRSDALHQGPDTRRVLCDMIANRESDLEELRAENDGLRNDADLLRAMLSQVQTEKRCHMAENAKLRELVKRLVNCVDRISNEDTFYYQPRRDGCGFDCTANGEGCSFIKLCEQARELGVEVDG